MNRSPEPQTASTEPALADANRDLPLRTSTVLVDAACDGCGYNLRGLAVDARCPECGHAVAQSLTVDRGTPVGRADRRWAALVLIGLAILLLTFPSQLWVVLQMRFADAAFGTAPRLNVPGPKVWAVPLVQRSLGYRVETLGAEGTWMSLVGVIAVFLITTPRRTMETRTPAATALAFATRWAPPILVGGYFGFLMDAEGTYDNDISIAKYAMVGVAAVELPCTALLCLYLALISRESGLPAVRRQLLVVAFACAAVQAAGTGMLLLAASLDSIKKQFVIQLWSALYEAACVIVALMMIAAMLQLMHELVLRILPRRVRAWLD